MNSKQLFYFTTVAETGSFTAAAQKLGLSQPPLSKQVMLLEEELGVTLFSRGSRKVELTEAGAYLYAQSRNILSLMDTAAREVSDLSSTTSGVLKLGTISSSGYMLTGSFLKTFCQRYPHVRFEITEGNTYELLEKLKNGLIECAILRTPFNNEGFQCVHGPEEPLVAVGDPAYFKDLTCQEDSRPSGCNGYPSYSIRLTDLAGKPLIYYRRFDSIISVAFQNIGVEPYIFCRNDDARTSLLWAWAGLGVALIPQSISNLPLSQNLEIHPIESSDTTTHMAAVYKKNGYVSNIAKEFVSSFREFVRESN